MSSHHIFNEKITSLGSVLLHKNHGKAAHVMLFKMNSLEKGFQHQCHVYTTFFSFHIFTFYGINIPVGAS